MSDKLFVVTLPDNRGRITCCDEAKARDSLAKNPGATFGYRPWPSTVKMPLTRGNYTVEPSFDGDGYWAQFPPLGVGGWGDTPGEAYSAMLRAIREHLEAATEVPLEV